MKIEDKAETVRERKFVIQSFLDLMRGMPDAVRPCFGCMATGAVYVAAMIARRHVGVDRAAFLDVAAEVWDDLDAPHNQSSSSSQN